MIGMLGGLEFDFLLGELVRSDIVHLTVLLSLDGVLDFGHSISNRFGLVTLFFEGHSFSFKRLLELSSFRVKSVVVSPLLL